MTKIETGRRDGRPDFRVRLDRPAGPQTSPEPDPAERRLSAEQTAERDHASGGFDEFYLLQLGGPLPYELLEDTTTRRLRSEATKRQQEDQLIGRALIIAAELTGVRGRGIAQLANALRRATGTLDQLRGKRQEHVDVLEGRLDDGSGRNRTGPVPGSRQPILWAVRAHGFTAAIAILELIALWAVFAYALAVDNPRDLLAHPEVTATAVLGATVIIGSPIVLGILLRGPFRNAEHRPLYQVGRCVLFAVLTGLWLVTNWAVAVARAEAFAAMVDTGLGATQAVASDARVWLLFTLFTLLGAITLWHQSRHNWHTDEVVRLNAQEHRLLCEIGGLEAEAAGTLARQRTQQAVADWVDASWREHIEVTLPSVGEDCKQHYRAEMIRGMGDPGSTSALGVTGPEPFVHAVVPARVADQGNRR